MEAVPLIPKAKVLPNIDTAPLLRELFQNEFEAVVPTRKLSQNILTSLQYRKINEDDQQTFRSVEFLENLTNRRDNIIEYTENVLEAYINHEKNLEDIRKAEENVFETHANFLEREITFLEDKTFRDFLSLKRQPLFKSLDVNYVKKYQLLQGEAGLPLEYEANSDFRVKNFKRWRNKLESSSQGNLIVSYVNKAPAKIPSCPKPFKKDVSPTEPKKVKKLRPKNRKLKETETETEVLRAEPKIVFFTDYKLGDVYMAEIRIKNVHIKKVQFQLKPMCVDGPFRAMLSEKHTTKVSPGLSFHLIVEFAPKSLDNAAEDIIIVTEDGNRLLIPLIAYLEPPILKTHKEIDEFTKVTSERIASSYIECGACLTGDTKVTKLKFRCYRGSGEFFIMSSENWNRNYINTVTLDNILEIPPFRVYPVFFKIEKDEVIDLFVEFLPKTSGMHVENIVIACDNGQIKSLDLLGDAVGWHSYYFSFQDSLLKELPPEKDDDVKVKYYLDFDDTMPNGKVEKVFCISNNSNMAFEFQWKIREANISSNQEKYLKLSKYEVKIDPENGTFEPNSIWEFLVTIAFNNAETGNYRMVLSLYVLNLPYQCIEEDNTIIQPTGLVRNLYSQSLYGEEECSALSPELPSLQGTYESLQESIKSYVEYQIKALVPPRQDFCKSTCIPNPGLCAKPLKKSKTFFNIGEDEGLGCVCRLRPVELESNSESCISNARDDKGNEMSPQRNEVIWDFVDILVDEVELWVEVVSTRVTLEPSVIKLSSPINLHDQPVFKEVRIVNHNQCPVICSWLMPSGITSTEMNLLTSDPKSNSASVALLFDKKLGNKDQEIPGTSVDLKKYQQQSSGESKQKADEIGVPAENSLSENNNKENSKPYKITVKPKKTFTVPGLSEFTCEIGISAGQAGKIQEMLCLNVNEGDLKLDLLILGTAVRKNFEVFPDVLDFGVLRQGTRYTNDFEILNESTNPLFWRINHFKFCFKEEQFLSNSNTRCAGSLKKTKGVLAGKGNSAVESYCLDARIPGIKCSLLEIEENNAALANSVKQYILVLGDVKMPKLSLSSPRFANAILAPPGMMYVGRKISTKVTLTNISNVETVFTWGHPFGCHSRKIKVEISPKVCRIQPKEKLTLNIDLTALDEASAQMGIISHCYIPCFFCRSAEPLILSVVAIAENINVTFEIIDYPMQSHASVRGFLKSPFYHTVLRVCWPAKLYDPNLALKYINEKDVLNMKCHCQEVEEEALRAFDESKHDSVQGTDLAVSEKNVRSLRSVESVDESSQKSKKSFRKSNKTVPDEDLKLSDSNLSGLYAPDHKKSEENSVTVYTYVESSTESLQFKKSLLEFLSVPYNTPILRQFVIRNETPIETSFQINVCTYGVSKNLPDRRVDAIKNRVFGYSNDDFQNKLSKDQPLVIVVEPSRGELKPYDAVCINVHCYGNTWGEYRDHLICQVKGIEPFHLKMFIQIVGHPIYFPIFKTWTSQKPTLRFQSLNCNDKPSSKQIKVVNRSAIPLSISWIVFLTKPLPKEEREDSYNLCVDSNANFDSNHSREESTQSSKNYIPKNASESVSTLPNAVETKDFSQNSETFKSFTKTESSSLSSITKKEKKESGVCEKKLSTVLLSEETKSDTQQLSFPGRLDTSTFQVDPKEMFFEPFEQKKLTITFNPKSCKTESYPQEFEGFLASCVKLKSEDEKCPGLYYRPCGINFVSGLMDLNAFVEIPLVSFEILKGDLKFIVDSNAVVKSESKNFTISRKYLIKNKNQKSVSLKIEILPGLIFRVKRVNTLDKFYTRYNPNNHDLKIEPGQLLEMEMQCSVTYKDVIYAFEQLKLSRRKEQCLISSGAIKASISRKYSNENDRERSTEKEPWKRHFSDLEMKQTKSVRHSLGHKDSFEINLNRMSSKSDNSLCHDDLVGRCNYGETEGEYFELPIAKEILCRPKLANHMTVVEEEINFVQSGLVTQTLMAELHISFPAVKLSPKCLDFGNVYLGETAVRYCSVINLSGFPTDFRLMAMSNAAEFTASPLTGSLSSASYNMDIGKTIKIEFKPSQPGYFKEVFHVYCNLDLEFDFYELFVSGLGTWNEKYKFPKCETYTKMEGIYSNSNK